MSATEVSAALSPPSSSAPEPLGAAAASCSGWASAPTDRSTSRVEPRREPSPRATGRVGVVAFTAACFAEEEHAGSREQCERRDSEQGRACRAHEPLRMRATDLNAT